MPRPRRGRIFVEQNTKQIFDLSEGVLGGDWAGIYKYLTSPRSGTNLVGQDKVEDLQTQRFGSQPLTNIAWFL